MSLLPDYRRCPSCGTVWSFNPDVGHFRCPHCGSMRPGMPLGPQPFDPLKALDWLKRKK